MLLIERWNRLKVKLPNRVNLLAVSKGFPEQDIRVLAGIGQKDFGESRLQEALPKLSSLLDLEHLRWHFIGTIQSNKVRKIVQNFQIIHSVDSLLLAKRISRIAGEEKKDPRIMIQVKLREDPTKGGLEPSYLLEVWHELRSLPNMKVIGLMTMAPRSSELAERRILFKECRELADQLGLLDCSMGMSSDWEVALESGATWLRVGSSLFGKRL